MDELEKKQVYKILLMPISCKKEYSNIECKEDKILTGQKYIQSADEDMSDFTIGFYEILYRDILKLSPILKENGGLLNNEFAGDTMNSFNSIVNITPGAGKTTLTRTSEENWPSYLKEYFHGYHCLANFWLIPIDFGRKSKKKNYYDSIDIFLNKVIEEYNNLSIQYKNYFENVVKFEDFFSENFVHQPRETSIILENYSIKRSNSKILVENAWNDINKRAYDISKSQYADKLWEYFNELQLFDKSIYRSENVGIGLEGDSTIKRTSIDGMGKRISNAKMIWITG